MPFNHRNERFLTALANLAAIAIENARLYERQVYLYDQSQEQLAKVERRNRELDSLRDILGALQSTLSLAEVLAKITSGVVQGLNYQAVMLATTDDRSQLLTIKEVALGQKFTNPNVAQPRFAKPKAVKPRLQKRAKAFIEKELLDHTILLSAYPENIGAEVCSDGYARVTHQLDVLLSPIISKEGCNTIQELFHLQTFAVLPIRSDDRLFGVLYAGTTRTEIMPPHLEALQAFANQAALAIKNARQFEHVHERLRRRVKGLQGMQDIDRLISSTADFEMMLQSILDMSLKLVDAECGNIALVDNKTEKFVPIAIYPEDSIVAEAYEQGLMEWMVQHQRTIRIADLARTPWVNSYRELDIHSEIAVPILVGEELVGVINVGSAKVAAFTQEDESLLEILATQTAVAIQMTSYYRELEKTRERSYEAERLAAMSDMASNMVHNINNSVGAIRVLVQQIRFKAKYDSLSPEFLAKKLESIERSAEKTLDMARNIRNPFQNLATEPTDVNISIHNALTSFEPIPSTLTVNLALAPHLPAILATQQLEEVFRNLISNGHPINERYRSTHDFQ